MLYKNELVNAAENAHFHALAAARKAIRAGDLVKAERWMRLAERHYRCHQLAEREAYDWRKYMNDHAAWRKARDDKNRLQVERMRREEAKRDAEAGAA